MALFDFMKGGATPSVDKLPDNVKTQAVEAAKPIGQAMSNNQPRPESNNAPAGQTGGKEALMHNQSGAGKTQEALSPTDSHKGHTQSQGKSRGWER